MSNEELDLLESYDTLDDTMEFIAASDPTVALIDILIEEAICEPIRDVLERF